MKFVLAGYRQNENIRYYSFQGIGEDRRTRTEFSVGVDLTLLHKHGIPLQEAPLLCSSLLSSRAAAGQLQDLVFPEHDLMFREEDMLVHAQQRAREQAAAPTHGKPKPLSQMETPASPSPMLIDSRAGRSGIGLGSRSGLPLAEPPFSAR